MRTIAPGFAPLNTGLRLFADLLSVEVLVGGHGFGGERGAEEPQGARVLFFNGGDRDAEAL